MWCDTIYERHKSLAAVRRIVHLMVRVISLSGYPERSEVYDRPPDNIAEEGYQRGEEYPVIQPNGLRHVRLERQQAHNEKKQEYGDTKPPHEALYLFHGPSFIRWAQPVFLVWKIDPLERKPKGEAMTKVKGAKQKDVCACHEESIDIIGCPAVCHPVCAIMDGNTRG